MPEPKGPNDRQRQKAYAQQRAARHAMTRLPDEYGKTEAELKDIRARKAKLQKQIDDAQKVLTGNASSGCAIVVIAVIGGLSVFAAAVGTAISQLPS